MALHWNMTAVKDWRQHFPDREQDGERYWNSAIECFAVSCMITGIGEVTEKNAREVFIRLNAYERAMGAMRGKVGADGKREDVYFTLDEIKKLVGFKVNVKTESRAWFLKNLGRIVIEDAEREAYYAERKAEREVSNA